MFPVLELLLVYQNAGRKFGARVPSGEQGALDPAREEAARAVPSRSWQVCAASLRPRVQRGKQPQACRQRVPGTHPSVPTARVDAHSEASRGSDEACEGTTRLHSAPHPVTASSLGLFHPADLGISLCGPRIRGNCRQGGACACVCRAPCLHALCLCGRSPAPPVSLKQPGSPWALAACPASCLTMDILFPVLPGLGMKHSSPAQTCVSAAPPSTAVCPAITGPGSHHEDRTCSPHPPLPPAW